MATNSPLVVDSWHVPKITARSKATPLSATIAYRMQPRSRSSSIRRGLRWLSIAAIVLTVSLYAGSESYTTGYTGSNWEVRLVLGQVIVLWNLPMQPATGFYRHSSQGGFFPFLFSPPPLPPARNAIVPMWVPAFLAAPLLLVSFAMPRLREGRCSNCDYDLTRNTSDRCPECGRVAAPRTA